ncbi:MAG: hypothetical protein HKM07_02625 [Chlamydiae bacterium]|nr:hypothetical protein [Chlamydiota bacterium]
MAMRIPSMDQAAKRYPLPPHINTNLRVESEVLSDVTSEASSKTGSPFVVKYSSSIQDTHTVKVFLQIEFTLSHTVDGKTLTLIQSIVPTHIFAGNWPKWEPKPEGVSGEQTFAKSREFTYLDLTSWTKHLNVFDGIKTLTGGGDLTEIEPQISVLSFNPFDQVSRSSQLFEAVEGYQLTERVREEKPLSEELVTGKNFLEASVLEYVHSLKRGSLQAVFPEICFSSDLQSLARIEEKWGLVLDQEANILPRDLLYTSYLDSDFKSALLKQSISTCQVVHFIYSAWKDEPFCSELTQFFTEQGFTDEDRIAMFDVNVPSYKAIVYFLEKAGFLEKVS